MPAPDLHPLWLSLSVAAGALLLAFPTGVGIARWLGKRHFRGKDWLESFFLLPLVLPPVITGLLVLVVLGKRGPLGRLLWENFGIQWIFTPTSAVIVAAIVAFPLVYQSARAAFAATEAELEMVARVLGASPLRTFWTITLPLAWPGLAAGAILAFARALGEFGATVMVAGNIAGKTLTAPVAIYFAVEDGKLATATYYALALAALNVVFLVLVNTYLRRRTTL